jgi:hypothetical protein
MSGACADPGLEVRGRHQVNPAADDGFQLGLHPSPFGLVDLLGKVGHRHVCFEECLGAGQAEVQLR